MTTVIDALIKGLSVKEIEEILFRKPAKVAVSSPKRPGTALRIKALQKKHVL